MMSSGLFLAWPCVIANRKQNSCITNWRCGIWNEPVLAGIEGVMKDTCSIDENVVVESNRSDFRVYACTG